MEHQYFQTSGENFETNEEKLNIFFNKIFLKNKFIIEIALLAVKLFYKRYLKTKHRN